jgi:hypothetical protein
MAAAHRHSLAVLATAAAVATSAVVAPARDARADEVASTPKAIVGLGLAGAGVVTITESLIGVKEPWAYIVGAIVGAGGGAVGGYFVDQGSSDGKASMYCLAGGMALVIPALVLTLNATRYQPEVGATEDRPPTGPTPEPGTPGGTMGEPSSAPVPPPTPPAPPPAPPPQSLLDVHEGAFRVGLPLPAIRPLFTVAEQRDYGIKTDGTEVRMPVLHVTF